LAGQYLRSEQDVDPSEFTFLETPKFSTTLHRSSVNLSPQLIWRVTNHFPSRTPSKLDRSADAQDEFGKSVSPLLTREAVRIEPAPRTSSTMDQGVSFVPSITDRFATLQEFANWVASSVAISSTPIVENRVNTIRSTVPSISDRFATLQEFANWVVSTVAISSTTNIENRINTIRSTQEFVPLSLQYSRTPSSGSFESAERQVGTSRTTNVQSSQELQATWHTTTNFSPHADPMFFVSLSARQTTENRIPEVASKHYEEANYEGHTQWLVTPMSVVGTVAGIGIHRTPNINPAVVQGMLSKGKTHGLPDSDMSQPVGGISAASSFHDSVTIRHVRMEDSSVSPSMVATASLVVRSNPSAPSSSVAQSQSTEFTFRSSTERESATPINSLPPNLMQQLTEQVVRAIDSRALAASERAGRF
jgi:hypothetical protein